MASASSSSAPLAIEALSEINDQDLAAIEARYKEQSLTATLSTATEFEYGWALVRSGYREDRLRGITLLERLLDQASNSNVAGGQRQRERECLYYLAVGYFRVRDYALALKRIDQLLQLEPQNAQALSLKEMIGERVRRDGLVGATMVGGLAVLGLATLASWLLKRK